ncbi:hypothetical protein CYLTODRAFT_369495 [Cylindrobasidium torrendii FP15055 ss-10]|uniref:Uncharacterized protein n=1 Tax=Cylindrobasidium torrendii FP15055 ss-10 TaxID=1314674 RepID=A0A0D7BMD8_9AGAR|nr:hypothetical protein CYLTODRAFT_369495 [Cylindrobasidium torrendii FP15055 ss-10]
MPLLSLAVTIAVTAPFFYLIPSIRRSWTRLVLCIYAIFLLHNAAVHPPPNIFTRLHMPLSTPTDAIRAFLLSKTDLPDLPEHIEVLLKRLSSLEARLVFVRFGEDVLAHCDWCHSNTDFVMYALPKALWAYIREAAIVGWLTRKGTNLSAWRSTALCVLLGAAGAEAYVRATVVIEIKGDSEVSMWNDNLELARIALFALLPLVVEFALPRIPTPPHPALAHLHGLREKIFAASHMRGAILRSPELRRKSLAYWEKQRQEGKWIRESDNVKFIARNVDLPYERRDDRGRVNARNSAQGVLRLAGFEIPGER